MASEACRFLRPFLQSRVGPGARQSYLRFFSACSAVCAKKKPALASGAPSTPAASTSASANDLEKRVALLNTYTSLHHSYPRLADVATHGEPISIRQLRERSDSLDHGATEHAARFAVSGRVRAVRTSGNKLVFVDVEQDGRTIQVIANFAELETRGVTHDRFTAFRQVVRRGDWFTFDGHPHKSRAGEPSLVAAQLPRLVSPSLHQLPKQLDDAETRARRPHVDMLVHRHVVQTLRMRSHIERHLASFFDGRGYQKVTTPLLTAGAGGAVARPFETVATELEGTTLNLRIAPELWLKRLLVGGMGSIYEIGPAFRNEGVDATHNPEFTICESYKPFADLPHLMAMTEDLLLTLHDKLRQMGRQGFEELSDSIVDFDNGASDRVDIFNAPFPRLPFIPTLEREMGRRLPNLDHEDATQLVLDLFSGLSLRCPPKPTLPRLLDALSAAYLEPLCDRPTFITEHPVILSPLAKSFTCPHTEQHVSARAELFIRGHEYANMYEEENSPLAQRNKFREQLRFREVDGEGDGRTDIDESYIEALEWGLPPTGGWGMGVDRLVMLFTGQKRIGDVLPFGTLRNVVGLATRQK
ncbi:hypothetical protein MBLNU459_g6690t1 [Dothideomycetes sp. NU459]